MKLNKLEEKIFAILQSTCEKYSPDTVLRVAGGWVRDQLLDYKADMDIDIAVSNMSGRAFAELVAKHQGGKVNVIEANPDQSKHLETAQLHIEGQLVEFANLRTETYSESRIPTIEVGTPEEDAHRRDLTMNSLFYNLSTKEVEDYVGGIKDLEARIARTPMDPRQTFLDDPLRILRTLRFATRYGLQLDSELKAAVKLPEVKEAFANKVSRERIWKELVGQQEPEGWKRGILTAKSGTGIFEAITNLYEFGYFPLIFSVKRDLKPWDTDQQSSHHDLNVIGHTLKAFEHLVTRMELSSDPEDCAVRHLALLLHDIGKLDGDFQQDHSDGVHKSYVGHQLASYDMTIEVLNGLKAPSAIRDRVALLVKHHMRYHWLEENPKDKALRKVMADMGEDWVHLIDVSTSDAYGKLSVWDVPGLGYAHFRERSEELLKEQSGLTKIKRPINGHDLMGLGVKPGPKMGELLSGLDEQLLDNPMMTREEALEFVSGEL